MASQKGLHAFGRTGRTSHTLGGEQFFGSQRVDENQRTDEGTVVANRHNRLNDGGAIKSLLDLLGGDILAALGLEEALGAAGDHQAAVFVEVTDVAGVEPAIGIERLGAVFRQVPVAGADRAALEVDDATLGVSSGAGQRNELDFDTRNHLAHSADLVGSRAVGGDGTTGLGQAVALHDVEADALVEADHLGRDGGATRAHYAQTTTETSADGAEHQLVGDPVREARLLLEGPLDQFGLEALGAGDFAFDLFFDLAPDLGHAEQNRRTDDLHHLAHFFHLAEGCRNSVPEADVLAIDALIAVCQRQVAQVDIRFVEVEAMVVDALARCRDVGVGEGDTLGLAGRARGVDHGADVAHADTVRLLTRGDDFVEGDGFVARRRASLAFGVEEVEYGLGCGADLELPELAVETIGLLGFDTLDTTLIGFGLAGQIGEQQGLDRTVGIDLLGLAAVVSDQKSGTTVVDDVVDCVSGAVGINGNGDCTQSLDGDVCPDPFGAVPGEDGDAVTALHAGLLEVDDHLGYDFTNLLPGQLDIGARRDSYNTATTHGANHCGDEFGFGDGVLEQNCGRILPGKYVLPKAANKHVLIVCHIRLRRCGCQAKASDVLIAFFAIREMGDQAYS